MIKKISFKNYKLYRNQQTIQLKPITILIGKNNSGKSSVAKLPLMVAGSLNGSYSMPLKWDFELGNDKISLGTEFKDLLYNRNTINSLDFEINIEEDNIKVSLIDSGNNKVEFLEYIINGLSYEINPIDFKGFIHKSMRQYNLKVDFISAFRCKPEPSYRNSFEDFNYIGKNGQNAYSILINDFLKNSEILSNVSNWYEYNLDKWKIEVIKIDAKTDIFYQLALSTNGINPINITNVGEGIHQVLPLIVRSYMPAEEPTLIVIEEPETHLHPAAHGPLAQRLIDSFKENSNRNYLIETHSQNFVLRLRRAVAEKKILASDVAIYYVDFDDDKQESTVKEIVVDEKGSVKWWPSGIFSETLEETTAIKAAQTK